MAAEGPPAAEAQAVSQSAHVDFGGRTARVDVAAVQVVRANGVEIAYERVGKGPHGAEGERRDVPIHSFGVAVHVGGCSRY